MKVLHLSSEKHWRGGEQQIAYLLVELAKAGIENIVAARRGSPFENFCRSNRIKVFPLPFKSAIDPVTAFSISRIAGKEKVDLIHLHSAKSHSLAVISSLFGNKTPLVLSRRVVFPPSNGWFTRWKYNHASVKRVVCVSNEVSRIMKDYLDEPGKVGTVYSGIDISRFPRGVNGENILRKEFNIPENVTLIGNTAALEYEKDYFTFIRTIEVLVRKGIPVHAVIIGKGSRHQELKELVKELGLENDITFAGFRTDLVSVLPCLDIFLMTSTLEGLGTSVLDAFCAGVTVVATAAGGIPEMVKHEQSGLLAPIGDHSSLAANIERLIADPSLKSRLDVGALQTVQGFTKEQMAQRTLEVYNSILAEQSLIFGNHIASDH